MPACLPVKEQVMQAEQTLSRLPVIGLYRETQATGLAGGLIIYSFVKPESKYCAAKKVHHPSQHFSQKTFIVPA